MPREGMGNELQGIGDSQRGNVRVKLTGLRDAQKTGGQGRGPQKGRERDQKRPNLLKGGVLNIGKGGSRGAQRLLKTGQLDARMTARGKEISILETRKPSANQYQTSPGKKHGEQRQKIFGKEKSNIPFKARGETRASCPQNQNVWRRGKKRKAACRWPINVRLGENVPQTGEYRKCGQVKGKESQRFGIHQRTQPAEEKKEEKGPRTPIGGGHEKLRKKRSPKKLVAQISAETNETTARIEGGGP